MAFLKAEMAVNGWDATGDAKTLYEGIRISFEQYQAENYVIAGTAAPDAYSDPRRANNYTPGSGLQRHRRMGRRPFGGKAAREIITQKWIASIRSERRRGPSARRTGSAVLPTPTSTNASNEPNLPTEGASRIPFARTNRRATPTTTMRRWPCWAPAAAVRNAVVGCKKEKPAVERFCRPAISQCNPKKTTSMKKILLIVSVPAAVRVRSGLLRGLDSASRCSSRATGTT
ncbi:MAG: SusD/RagB family nutrient-binding outer membrane lipoprotein [Alistipes sp.]